MAMWGKITLFDAAADGNIDMVQTRLTNSWTHINAQDHPNGDTAIALAAKWGHPEVIGLLLEKGADATIANNVGQTPLHLAADMGQLEACRVLIEKGGVDPNVQDLSGFTSLHAAAGKAHTATCVLLLEHGADKTIKNYSLQTPLQCASTNETASVLKDFKFQSATKYD